VQINDRKDRRKTEDDGCDRDGDGLEKMRHWEQWRKNRMI